MLETESFLAERPRLHGLAYRMLGSFSEAEDVLQEAFLRWSAAEDVRQPRAFLTRVVTNLCLDHLRSAARRREEYPGTWLPEPVVSGPEDRTLQEESLRYAFVRLLQELNPKERAAYLLREVFGHDYAELAQWLDETPDNSRQLVSRAARKLDSERQRFPSDPSQVEKLLHEFLAGVASGDLQSLKAVLHSDVVMWSDGGGKARAALNPVYGSDKVARFFVGVTRKSPGLQPRVVVLNGRPGLLVDDGVSVRAALFDVDEARLSRIYLVSNPDKLRHLQLAPGRSPDPSDLL